MSASIPRTTPEFLAWTLVQPCVLKEFDGWNEPERVERHLRSAREYGAASQEGRCRGERCYDRLETPTGYFQVSETLQIYGGADRVATACQNCPANALEQLESGSLAGCYGELPLPQPAAEFYTRVDAAIERLDLASALKTLFPVTKPRWFGLWLQPLVGDAAATVGRLIGDLSLQTGEVALRLFRQALSIAAGGTIPLHAVHYPRGSLEGRRWKLAPYCVHCHAEIADYRRPCSVCGRLTQQIPSLVRHVRGNRPWRPLP